MGARLLYRERIDYDDGAILEIVIWRLPKPVTGSTHDFKYRLFYGFPGKRLVGFDNEQPKGDHCHIDEAEMPYTFTSAKRLIDDFLAEVSRRRKS